MISDHFIDINIVLGATINWDSQSKPVTIYVDELDQSTTVHTSDKVFNEALHVVYKQRQLAKRAARIVFESFKDEFSQSNDRISLISSTQTSLMMFEGIRFEVFVRSFRRITGYIMG